MRKSLNLVLAIILIAIVFVSCRPRKHPCPAYKSQHIIETEKVIQHEGKV